MNAPTVEEVRSLSDYLGSKFAEDDDPAAEEELSDWIDASTGLISELTGRSIGAEAPGEDVPTYLVALAKRATVMKIEALVTSFGGTFQERRSTIGSGNLASFSAGAYAESYFSPEITVKAGMLDPDPAIAEILWALATEEKRDEWTAKWTGVHAPASAVQSFEWGQRPGGY